MSAKTFVLVLATITLSLACATGNAATVAVWLNDGVGGRDEVGNNDSSFATIEGNPTLNTDTPFDTYSLNRSLDFDGNNSLLSQSVGAGSALHLTSKLTIECWIKGGDNGYDDSPTYRMIVGWHEVYGLLAIENSSGTGPDPKFAFGYRRDGLNFEYFTDAAAATLDDGNWHHIAATFDDAADQVVLYVDGEQDGAVRTAGGTGSLDYVPPKDFYMGSDGSGRSYKGLIDEVRISDTVLSPADLGYHGTLATAPTFTPVSVWLNDAIDANTVVDDVGDNDFTTSGALTPSLSPDVPFARAGNHSLSFDGTGERMWINSMNGTTLELRQELTLEAWIKGGNNVYDGTPTFRLIAGHHDAYALVAQELDGGDPDPRFSFVYYQGENRRYAGFTEAAATTLDDGEWHHIAASFSLSREQVNLFVDGVLDRQHVLGVMPGSALDYTDETFYMGSDDAERWYKGLIDEVRVSEGALWETQLDDGRFALPGPPEGTIIVVR